jgi:cytochrome P450
VVAQLPAEGADLQDPHAALASLRVPGGVVVRIPTEQEMQMFSTYSDVYSLLRHPDLARTPPGGPADTQQRIPPIDRIRQLTLPAFSQPRMRALEQSLHADAHERIIQLQQRAEFDLFGDYYLWLSSRMLMRLLGIPFTESRVYLEWFAQISPDPGTPEIAQAQVALTDMGNRAVTISASTDADPASVLGRLRRADATDGEISSITSLLVMAGYEPTANAMALGQQALIRNGIWPDQHRAGIEITQALVDELLRYDGPVYPGAFRWAHADVRVGENYITHGEAALLNVTSANRDPSQFTEPTKLIPDRPDASKHLAFGAGLHRCVGAPLARITIRAGLGALADAPPQQDPPEWRTSILRGFRRIPARYRVALDNAIN